MVSIMPIRMCCPRLTVRIHADSAHRLVPAPQKASAYMPPNISKHATPAMRTSLNMKSRLTTKRDRMPGSSLGSSMNPRISTSRCWASRRKLLKMRSYTPLPNWPRKRASSTKTIVFLMRGEAASLIGRGYSHRCTGGATAIFIRRPFPAFEKNNRRNRIFSGNTT